MINVRAPGIALPERAAPPVKRIGPGTFLMICGIQGVVIAAIFFWLLFALVPQRVPLAQSGDYVAVREAILARINRAVDDPLVELAPGVSARESNVRGFRVNGQTYYYSLEGQRSFDPLSRGAVDARAIEIVVRDQTEFGQLAIYRVLDQ